jgi:cytochrome c556
MMRVSMSARQIARTSSVLVLAAGIILSANAQTGTPAAREAIEVRKSVFTLIAANFQPVGNVLKSNQYDAAEVQKSLARLKFLSEEAAEAFPPVSNIGEPETKAKPDIWANRAEFDKKLSDFQTHVTQLAQVNETEKGPTSAFKTAAGLVGQDCKGCHDSFKAK